jgi:hypothetical protein
MTKKRKTKLWKRHVVLRLGTTFCKRCSKVAWLTSQGANEEVNRLKSLPGAHKPDLLDSYRCPHGPGWHVGHNYKLKWISLCIGEHK